MNIIEINNYRDFISLEEKWREVLQRCNHTIFSTWEWLSIWWKHFGNGKRLYVLLAEDNGKIIGIAPLMYSVDTLFGLRRGKIEFIGTPDSDYADFILVDRIGECIKLFIDYLNNIPAKWDYIDLKEMPENSKSLPFLNELCPKSLKTVNECTFMSLPKSYEIFLMNLNHKMKKDLSRTSRRIEETFKVKFADYSDSQSVSEGVQLLFKLHQKRWESRGFPGIFANQKVRDFHFEMAQLLSQRKWLRLHLLYLSGKPVAAEYGFAYRSKFYLYITGRDPEYYKYSVSNLLRAHIVRKLIEEKVTEYDFIRGKEDFKKRWSIFSRKNYQIMLVKKSLVARIQHHLYDEYWHQVNRFHYIFWMYSGRKDC